MIGVPRPCPRQNLTVGLVLIDPDDGVTPRGRISEVRQVTQVGLEGGTMFAVSDDDPVPIVAEVLPDPPEDERDPDEAPAPTTEAS